MKKILGMIVVAMLVTSTAGAALVNVTRPGTSWVWRVNAGDDMPFILVEDGTFFVTEDSKRIVGNSSNAEALFNQLIAQGWEITDSAANIPQGIAGTAYAVALDFALNEDATPLVLENDNNLRMEN